MASSVQGDAQVATSGSYIGKMSVPDFLLDRGTGIFAAGAPSGFQDGSSYIESIEPDREVGTGDSYSLLGETPIQVGRKQSCNKGLLLIVQLGSLLP
jgi:hypothetical protein